MDASELDHALIHVDDWAACNDFYERVLGAEVVENPEGHENPVGS